MRLQIAALVAVVSISPVHADCLWDDKEGIDGKIDAYLSRVAPDSCRPLDMSGYHDLTTREEPRIVVEVIVRTNKTCFDRLFAAAKAKPFQCGGYFANQVNDYFDADGGPTLMFHFDVSPHDYRKAEQYRK